MKALDGVLEDWDVVKSQCQWNGILIGNGSSRAVWDGFGYESLFETSRSKDINDPLDSSDVALFGEFSTTNFEQILEALSTARRVGECLSQSTDLIAARYQHIRTALVESVHKRHVPWAEVSTPVLSAIRTSLLEYEWVYSTNYDLLIYWAIMQDAAKGFKDFFFDGRLFDAADTHVWGKVTRVLFLHGGLHLQREHSGDTMKRVSDGFGNLLETFGSTLSVDGPVPLFVAEGRSEDKVRAIRRSDYLTFCFEQLTTHNGPLVVFGHSLSDSDLHIIRALNRASIPAIAVSIVCESDEKNVERKAAVIKALPNHELRFFDAATHPLGSGSIKVP
jgi:hypothetical protein